MKFKKIIAGTLAALSLMSMGAYAEEEKVFKADSISLNEMFDGADIKYQENPQTGKVELKINNGEYTREYASGLNNSPDAPIFTAGKKYLNTVFCADMVFDFTDGGNDTKGPSCWNAFQLRAEDTDKLCWTTKCYVIIVKDGRVEIQKFGTGADGFLLNEDCEIPKDEKVNVKYGAVDTDKGVYVFIKIKDKIYGALDTNSTIKTEGYMNFEFRTNFKAYDTKDKELAIAVPNVSYNAKTAKLESENEFISAGTDKKAQIKENNWYLSTDSFMKKPAERYGQVEAEAWEKIDGETLSSMTVMTGDVGRYAKTAVVTEDGLCVMSNDEYISSAEYILQNGYVGLLDCNKAYMKGKYFTYDENNSSITPFEDEYIYLPVRGICEADGIKVAWDAENNSVFLDTNGNVKENNTLFSEYPTGFKVGFLGWIRFRLLMGTSMVTPPINVEGRTMLEYTDFGAALNYKNIYCGKDSGIITFSPIPLTFTAEDEKEIADSVQYGIIEK